MDSRKMKILELLTEEKRLEVSVLAQRLGVSQVTTRKDLEELEGDGLILREHGFARVGSGDDLTTRLAYHYQRKWEIARLAAGIVEDGETVMVESGSCCVLFSRQLAESGKRVTLVTNSAFLAGDMRRYSHIRCVLLGGEYQKDSQAMVGPLVRLCARQFSVEKLFFGVDGFSPDSGFSGRDLMRAEALQAMAEQGKTAFVLTESEKFRRRGVVPLLPLSQVTGVFTDGGIEEEQKEYLTRAGVALTQAVPGEQEERE